MTLSKLFGRIKSFDFLFKLKIVFLAIVFLLVSSVATASEFSSTAPLFEWSQNISPDASDLAFNAKGKGVFVWQENSETQNGDMTSDKIFFSFIALDGSVISPGIEVSSATQENVLRHSPKVGLDHDGNVVIMWTKQVAGINGNATIVYQRFDELGVPLSEELLVDVDPLTDEKQGGLIVSANGNFSIAWSSRSNITEKSANVFIRQFNADGSAKTLPIQLSVSPEFKQGAVKLRENKNGEMVVAWESWSLDQGWDIAFRTLDSEATFLSNERKIETLGVVSKAERSPSVSIREDELVLAWECRCHILRKQIFLQRFSLNGDAVSDQFQAPFTAKSNQVLPSVMYERNDQITLVWLNRNALQDATAIYSQSFSQTNTPNEPKVLLEKLSRQHVVSSLDVHSDVNGIHHMLWSAKLRGYGDTTLFYRNAQATLALEDRQVNPEAEIVYLAGVSYLNNVSEWQWTQLEGTPVELSAYDEDIVSFNPPNQDTLLKFKLTTKTADGFIATDLVEIDVNHEAGLFESDQLSEFQEDHGINSGQSPFFLKIVEPGQLDSSNVHEIQLRMLFSQTLQLDKTRFNYTGTGIWTAIPKPEYVKWDATSVMTIEAIAADGTRFKKLHIVKIKNTPSEIRIPISLSIIEWNTDNAVLALLEGKDPNDVLESCTWEQIDGIEVYDPQAGGPLLIEENISDLGDTYSYAIAFKLFGGISENTTIKLKRSCRFEDGFVQENEMSLDLVNTPYFISSYGYILETFENHNGAIAFVGTSFANSPPLDYCEVQQLSGPALTPTDVWNTFIVPEVEEDSVIEANLVCYSVEGEMDNKLFEFKVKNIPDFDFELDIPTPLIELESFELTALPVMPHSIDQCNAVQVEGVALEWTGPMTFSVPNIGFDQDATVEVTCSNTEGVTRTKEFTLHLRNVYHEQVIVIVFNESEMYSGHSFPAYVSYSHPWAEIIESSWEQVSGPAGSFSPYNPLATCFTPPDVEEQTDVVFQLNVKDSAGNERTIKFDITVFPEDMYDDNYEGPPDWIHDYCN